MVTLTPGINLTGQSFPVGEIFTGNGENAILRLVNAQSPDFTGVTSLRGAILDLANFSGEGSDPSKFDGVDLTDAQFTQATIKAASFQGATLVSTNFAGTPLDGVTIAGVNAEGIILEANSGFTAATVTDSFFYDVNFNFGQFQNVVLDDVNNGAVPAGVLPLGTPVDSQGRPLDFQLTFRSADLRGVSANSAQLAGTDFRSLDNPTTPQVETTQFNGLTLFENANLANANFRDTDVSRVNFTNANLNGANFRGATATRAAGLIVGTSGNDNLRGTGNAEYIFGNEGNDTLNGRGGEDKLIGGAGNDLLNGGSGADRFIFGDIVDTKFDSVLGRDVTTTTGFGRDTIQGFDASASGDKIDLTSFGITSADITITPDGSGNSVITSAAFGTGNDITVLGRSNLSTNPITGNFIFA